MLDDVPFFEAYRDFSRIPSVTPVQILLSGQEQDIVISAATHPERR